MSPGEVKYKDLDLESFVCLLPEGHRARVEYYEMRMHLIDLLKFSTKLVREKHRGIKPSDILALRSYVSLRLALEFAKDRKWV